MILNLFLFIIGVAFGVLLKVSSDYYQDFITQQRKTAEEMTEVLYRFKKIEEEKANL